MSERMMWGKSIKDIKLKWYPAIATIVGASTLLIGTWFFFERSLPNSSTQQAELSGFPTSSPDVTALPEQKPSIMPSASPSAGETVQPLPTEPASAIAIRQGILRVSNPTNHPVRVALLSQKTTAENATKSNLSYDMPAHWDFEPGEGSTKGLLLSLPNRNLKLRTGDVLVAFAQDGSRKYWGPYVVGETSVPVWNSKTAEWQLTLYP
jgi:hypothetical protein